MTKQEKEGLVKLLRVNVAFTDDVIAARNWIRRQMEIDERRRRPRGKYRSTR
jgi:hypothetical protein